MHPFHAHCREALAGIEAQGRYRRFTPLRKQAERFPLYRRPDGSEVLVWSSNDYLGMGGHPVVIEAACAPPARWAPAPGARATSAEPARRTMRWRRNWPICTASRRRCCSPGFRVELGGALHHPELAAGVAGVFRRQNHASMIAGIKGSRATCHIFRHNDLAHLEDLLRGPGSAPKLIAFKSVYSMDADIAPIGGICDLAERHDAMTYLDEVHAVGMYGPPAPAWRSATVRRNGST